MTIYKVLLVLVFVQAIHSQDCNWRFNKTVGLLNFGNQAVKLSPNQIPDSIQLQIDSFFVEIGNCIEKRYLRGQSKSAKTRLTQQSKDVAYQLVYSIRYPEVPKQTYEVEFLGTMDEKIREFPSLPKCDTVLRSPGMAAKKACSELMLSEFTVSLETKNVKKPIYKIQTKPDNRVFYMDAVELEVIDKKDSPSTIEVPMDLNDLF